MFIATAVPALALSLGLALIAPGHIGIARAQTPSDEPGLEVSVPPLESSPRVDQLLRDAANEAACPPPAGACLSGPRSPSRGVSSHSSRSCWAIPSGRSPIP